MSYEETEKFARILSAQLRAQDKSVEGVTIMGKRAAGVAFVLADTESSTPYLFWGSEPEDIIRQTVVDRIANGAVPIGFVRLRSRRTEAGSEIRTESQPFPGTEHLGPWASEMLNVAVEIVRSQWSALQ